MGCTKEGSSTRDLYIETLPLQVPKSVPNWLAQTTVGLLNFSGSDSSMEKKLSLNLSTVYLFR